MMAKTAWPEPQRKEKYECFQEDRNVAGLHGWQFANQSLGNPGRQIPGSASLNRGITSVGFNKSGTNVIAGCADTSSKRLATVDSKLILGARSEGEPHCRIYDDRGVLVANEL